jgi:hypothetical protein
MALCNSLQGHSKPVGDGEGDRLTPDSVHATL